MLLISSRNHNNVLLIYMSLQHNVQLTMAGSKNGFKFVEAFRRLRNVALAYGKCSKLYFSGLVLTYCP